MIQILIATHNKSKLKEIKKGLKNLINHQITLLSLKDVQITSNPEETGITFEENSLIKAKYYAELSKLPTISDDGGLGITILNGEPGVKSKRWLGYEMTDEELITHTLQKLTDIPKNKRNAYLQTCVTFFDPTTHKVIQISEKIKGSIALQSSGNPTNGYPFRAIFIVEKFNKLYERLTHQEHEQINHRLHALKKISKKILTYLLQ